MSEWLIEHSKSLGCVYSSFLKNPLFLLALSYIVPCLAAIHIPPRPVLRLGALGLIAIYTVYIFQIVDTSQIPFSTIYIYANIQFSTLLYSSYWLCISPLYPPSNLTTFSQKSLFIASHVFNTRGIGAPWGLKHLPPFSRSSPSYVPSHTAFLLSRTLLLLFCIALNITFSYFEQEYYYPSLRPGDYSEDHEHLFRRLGAVSIRELLIRAYLPLQFHLPAYTHLVGAHAFLSLLGVGLLKQEPATWPPLFGSLADAYTLRRFYRYFWHQFHRVVFVAHADFLTREILGIKKGGRLSRSLMALVVFGISAGMHAIGAKLESSKCAIWPVIHWFGLVGLGIVEEDLVRSRWEALERRIWGESETRTNTWRYIFGYMWVWTFFAWSLPKTIFPNIDCTVVD